MARGSKDRLTLLINLALILIGVHVANIVLSDYLSQFGIYPRNVYTLPWIVTAPFIHGSWEHLLNNLLGLLLFSAICLIKGRQYYFKASFFIIVVGGALVWLFGRNATHIGASGWIFGLWSLIIFNGFFERNFRSLILAAFVIFFYGGMIFGVLPKDPRISFESHLFGALAGFLFAYFYTNKTYKRKRGRRN